MQTMIKLDDVKFGVLWMISLIDGMMMCSFDDGSVVVHHVKDPQ